MKILIIEDDERIAIPVKEELEHQSYAVDIALDGGQGLEMALSSHYDVVVLDLMLPTLNGFSVCRQLRDQGNSAAILMLTARSEKRDKIDGLDSGADDYLTKPFDLEELSARVRALMRRPTGPRNTVLACGPLTIETAARKVLHGQREIDLTPTEYRLLLHFARNPTHFFKPEDLLDKLWSNDKPPGREAIKTHIKTLRRKLSTAGVTNDLIETAYGFGYRLNRDA